jgi:hypothetical protein
MPLAAPLLIPFAEAVGLSIAGLGAIEIGKKVQDFIEDNPEISMEILTSLKESLLMTLPGSGIGDIFMNKEDSGDDDEVEVKKDTRSKKEIVLEGLRKAREGKGNYSSPDATGSAVSAQGNIIRGLEDAGKIKKGPDPNYDPSKKYQGYKKFYKKADGGAIGIEVLFEEKKDGGRIGFANGGDNIIGADLKDPDTDMNEMIPSGGINFSDIKNYASIPATYGAALYGNYINQRVGENMARAFRTDEMNERLSQQVGDKLSTGVNSGGLTYTDFGLDPVREYIGGGEYRNTRDFNPPSFEKAMSLNSADLANALTLGNLNFNRDPSGNINYTGNKFDFPQPTFMNDRPIDVPLDELNVNAPQFSFTDYLQGNYDLNKSPTTNIFETPGVMVDANEGFRTPTRTNVQGRDLEADLGTRINPNIQPQQNIFQRAGNVFSSIKDNIPNFGIMGLLSSLDRFDTLSPEDQAFILDQAGGNRPSKDRYGINRRSAFGNYAQYVRDKGIFAPGKRGEYYRSISGLDQALMDTLDREQKAKAAYEKQIRDAADAASRNAARARSITAGYGGSDDSRGATGPTASGAGMGVGGGYASDYFGADGGSVPTGLATMFTRKR